MKIAVLLATYNRKEKTLTCLESLFQQQLPEGTELRVFLTDDASSDGTVEAVQKRFPGVTIFNGSGSLFWAGGMRISWSQAVKAGADYYLLLNDDTTLTKTAIATLLQYNNLEKVPTIRIGSTMDSASKTMSYGGRKVGARNRIDKNYSVYSDTEFVECDLGNANIMLVPAAVVASIGILSTSYTHGIADYDYTLRAKKAGFKAVVAPGILGYCTDDHGHAFKSQKVSLKERIKYLKSPKGLAYDEYLTFIRSHFPLYLPSAFVKLWAKTLFPFIWEISRK